VQQRVHRVRVDRDGAAGQRADPLHQLVAVRGILGAVVEHQQRHQTRATQIADQRIDRTGAS
jgi:hypothetical protein